MIRLHLFEAVRSEKNDNEKQRPDQRDNDRALAAAVRMDQFHVGLSKFLRFTARWLQAECWASE